MPVTTTVIGEVISFIVSYTAMPAVIEPPGSVDVENDLFAGRGGLEIEEALGDVLGGFVSDGAPEEDLTLLEEALLNQRSDGRSMLAGQVVVFLLLIVIVIIETG
jgi:hypothetical protein